MTKVGLYAIGKSTTLESYKSHHAYGARGGQRRAGGGGSWRVARPVARAKRRRRHASSR